MQNGGYEAGYAACSCFWGQKPGSLIQKLFNQDIDIAGLRVIDAGCGEGKNAFAIAERGGIVDAVDCSTRAVSTGRARFPHASITWHIADVASWKFNPESYDIVVAYGLLHCLPTPQDIRQLLSRFQMATRRGGINIVCAFDDGPQDLSAHAGFVPSLLSHDEYLAIYEDWDLIVANSSLLYETHPHNNIPHHHSLTRILAKKS